VKPAYYNEIDPGAAEWLRRLIAHDLIPAGDVDERSIEDVHAADLVGYGQCHFFAGLGGWPLAFRLAGIPDDANGWSGSVPCPDYSVASNAHGGAKGQGGSRHLWPAFRPLIAQRRPAIVVGEQVASAIGWGWWDEVAMDVEAEGYAAAQAVLRADAFGARHQRRRIYWVADAGGAGLEGPGKVRRIPGAAAAALAKYGDPLAQSRRALDGDLSGLLPRDGVSIKLERGAVKAFGNAIVPEVAQAFLECVMDAA
jgi:DNA (cytosine-5)-methyltransferase 1